MKDRFDWLQARLQESFDGESFESDGISVICHVLYQRKGTRTMRAEITWQEPSDDVLALDAAIDNAPEVSSEAPL